MPVLVKLADIIVFKNEKELYHNEYNSFSSIYAKAKIGLFFFPSFQIVFFE